MKLRLLFASAVALAASSVAATSHAQTCDDLRSLRLPNTTIRSAQPVRAGMFVPPDPMQPPAPVPDFCRVIGVISPVPGSTIGFEVWLPPEQAWNKKLMVLGNSGLSGVIPFNTPPASMVDAINRGYAAASTDTGHMGSFIDGSFAIGQPEKITDNAFRSVRETTAKAKTIVQRFFGQRAQHAFFNGCSTGGRQALLEAQRFPQDFDGIIAGSSTNFVTHVAAGAAFLAQQTLRDPTRFISAAKLPALAQAVLAACDEIDGLRDGLIDDPRQCRFDPKSLLCSGPETDRCLTAPQADALAQIYEGARNPRTMERIFPGFERGGEVGGPLDWASSITGPMPGGAGDILVGGGFLGSIGLQNPMFDILKFDLDKDLATIDAKLAALFNSTNPDLSAFAKRGGKLVMFHGWSDAVIAPRNSIDYFDSVVSQVGSAEKTQDFLRLFMAPGMQHCIGGPGPFVLDAVGALERWVEKDVPPATLLAVHVNEQGMPDRTRPLCPFPQVARFNGSGSIDDAASFRCVAAPQGK